MTNLLMSIAVLFSVTDGKLIETASKETAWYLDRLAHSPVHCVAGEEAGDAQVVVALGKVCRAFERDLPALEPDELQVIVRDKAGRTEVLLRGGSPWATRAAAMRFLEHCGVLFGPSESV